MDKSRDERDWSKSSVWRILLNTHWRVENCKLEERTEIPDLGGFVIILETDATIFQRIYFLLQNRESPMYDIVWTIEELILADMLRHCTMNMRAQYERNLNNTATKWEALPAMTNKCQITIQMSWMMTMEGKETNRGWSAVSPRGAKQHRYCRRNRQSPTRANIQSFGDLTNKNDLWNLIEERPDDENNGEAHEKVKRCVKPKRCILQAGR